jgi:hypothetical protein
MPLVSMYLGSRYSYDGANFVPSVESPLGLFPAEPIDLQWLVVFGALLDCTFLSP